MPRAGDQLLLAVLAGVIGLALLDQALEAADSPDAPSWLTVAMIPTALLWGIAGYRIGPHMRWAALLSVTAYGVVVTLAAGREQIPRIEVLALAPIAVSAAHAGWIIESVRRKLRARALVAAALSDRGPGDLRPGPEDLRVLGLDEGLLAEAGVLSTLLEIHAARERQNWVYLVGGGLVLIALGVTAQVRHFVTAGLSVLGIAAAMGVGRSLGVGKGYSAYDLLVSGRFERACTEFLTARIAGVGELPLSLLLATERELGIALRNAGSRKQLEQSVRSFERVLSVFPEHPDTWRDLGLALESLGEARGAAQALRRAISNGSRAAGDDLRRVEESGRAQPKAPPP
jgi:tetratricopeptide (TPR) repeat protein